MKVNVEIELTAAELTVIRKHWGQVRPVTPAHIVKWVRTMVEAAIADYRSNQDDGL